MLHTKSNTTGGNFISTSASKEMATQFAGKRICEWHEKIDLGINQGMILENVVAQMLKASGHELYFHEYLYKSEGNEKEKKYEIDFITVKRKKICPIEVKSSNYKSHKSFDYLLKKYQLKMEDRYIIYTKDLKYEDGITYIPVYMTPYI